MSNTNKLEENFEAVPQWATMQQAAERKKENNEISGTDEEVPQLVITNKDAEHDNERNKLQIRREARRKKILTNARNRLAKLNGRETLQSNGSTAYEEVSDPEVEPDIPHLKHNLPKKTTSVDFEFLNSINSKSSNNSENLINFDFKTLLNGAVPSEKPTTAPSLIRSNIWQRSRIHVILSALLTFLLSVYYNGELRVFGPIGACLISELLFFSRQREIDPLVNLLILLCGIQPQFAKRLMNFMLMLYNIFADMGIFVFCFSVLSILYIKIYNNSANLVAIQ